MIVFLVQLNLLLAEINGTILMPKIFKSVHQIETSFKSRTVTNWYELSLKSLAGRCLLVKIIKNWIKHYKKIIKSKKSIKNDKTIKNIVALLSIKQNGKLFQTKYIKKIITNFLTKLYEINLYALNLRIIQSLHNSLQHCTKNEVFH